MARYPASVTGDDGNPVALTPGAPLALRNMSVRVYAHHDQVANESWRFTVTDPAGVTATSIASNCWNSIIDDDSRVIWRGNGTYTVNVSTFTGTSCAGAPKTSTTYTYSVSAGVAITPPAATVLTRPANTGVLNTQLLGFTGNPGADSYEIRYAKGAVLAPDGSISGVSETAYLDTATGQIRLNNVASPGSYVVVARARAGDFYTAWSAPVTLTAIAPFDFMTRTFPDSRGPSYQVRATLREVERGRPRDGRGRQGQERQALPHAR